MIDGAKGVGSNASAEPENLFLLVGPTSGGQVTDGHRRPRIAIARSVPITRQSDLPFSASRPSCIQLSTFRK